MSRVERKHVFGARNICIISLAKTTLRADQVRSYRASATCMAKNTTGCKVAPGVQICTRVQIAHMNVAFGSFLHMMTMKLLIRLGKCHGGLQSSSGINPQLYILTLSRRPLRVKSAFKRPYTTQHIFGLSDRWLLIAA